VEGLSAHTGRGACTDAERRAALWLHDELRARGHEAWVETHWVRPQWAAALALGSLLAAGGSLAAVAAPLPGLVAAVLGLLTIVARPFPRRATQDVLTSVPDDGVVLAITAAYDVPRRGLIAPRWLRNPAPVVSAGVVVAAAAARVAGYEPAWLGAVQLVPTVALLLAMAAAADITLSDWAAGDAAPVALAVALFDELAREPPRAFVPALLLIGAGQALPGSVARRLRAEGLGAERAVLLEIVPGVLAWAARHPQVRAAAERAVAALDLDVAVWRMPPARLPAIRIAGSDDGALDLALGIVDALDVAFIRPRALKRGDQQAERDDCRDRH
jgi:hypothetical protein